MSRICELMCPEMYENPALREEKTFERREAKKETPVRRTVGVKTSKRSLTMRQYAVFLMENYPDVDIGRQRLYNWFRQEGIIPKGSRIPGKKYIQEGLFEVKYADTLSPNRFEPVTMISPRGQQMFTISILKEFQKQTA